MRASLAALAVGVCLTVACRDDPLAPPGSVRVLITTTGVDTDGAYELRAGERVLTVPGAQPSVDVRDLRPGTHELVLTDIASNCTVAGGATRSVTVRSGAAAEVEFVVACVAVTGAVGVTALVTGEELDADGFSVTIGSAGPQTVTSTTPRYVTGLAAGDYTVTLTGVAANCTVVESNPRTVRVVTGGAVRDTARAVFHVACIRRPGDVRVTVQTTGVSIDPDGYTITVGAGPFGSIPSNGTTTISLSHATYAIGLGGVAGNCSVVGGVYQLIPVPPGVVTDVRFDVTCTAITGIEIVVQTTGVDPDPDGVVVSLTAGDQRVTERVTPNGTKTFTPLHAATWTVWLTDIRPNCEITGGPSRTVTTTEGTVRLDIAVTCTVLQTIAYSAFDGNTWKIFTRKADGSGEQRLSNSVGSDLDPSWSPTGRIAFTSDRDGARNIYVMDANGSHPTRITTHSGHDESPAWSPDGTRIAFVSTRDGNTDIYVMNADGSNVTQLTNDPLEDREPTWSPDGTKIAFDRRTCTSFPCRTDIHVMNADGSGVIKITDGGYSSQPAWSPDGTLIAFARGADCGAPRIDCPQDIYVMSPTGTNVALVLADDLYDTEPAWSPSGTRLLVAVSGFHLVDGFVTELVIVRLDGSDPLVVVNPETSIVGPAWRR